MFPISREPKLAKTAYGGGERVCKNRRDRKEKGWGEGEIIDGDWNLLWKSHRRKEKRKGESGSAARDDWYGLGIGCCDGK